MIVIADIMREVVAAVSNEVFNNSQYIAVKQAIQQQLSNNVSQITYMHGHPVEIIKILAEFDQSGTQLKYNRYPLIAVFQDFDEQPVNGTMQGNLQIVIAMQTKPEFTAAERTNVTFKPILYPLYELLLRKIKLHKSILATYTIDHTKYDRVFWGSISNADGTYNMFNDYLDAIELQNVKLTFLNNNCSN